MILRMVPSESGELLALNEIDSRHSSCSGTDWITTIGGLLNNQKHPVNVNEFRMTA